MSGGSGVVRLSLLYLTHSERVGRRVSSTGIADSDRRARASLIWRVDVSARAVKSEDGLLGSADGDGGDTTAAA